MSQDSIVVRGARQHNLKDVDLEIPRDRLVVITGLSGSGKSSLAFDTIYAEGRRRYVESLSAYARQFLGQLDRPDADAIEGLSPTVAIDQRGISRNPRSTVGTLTEIYDYLRLLFARVGRPHCPGCGREISRQTPSQIVDRILELPQGARLQLLAPLVRERKGSQQKVLEDARKAGFVRVRVDGTVYALDEEIELDRYRPHSIELVVDRLVIRRDEEGRVVSPERGRLADSVETALRLGGGVLLVQVDGGEDLLFSEHLACAHCGISMETPEPRHFSFNNPHGACPECTGLGTVLELDPDLIVPDAALSLERGAIAPWEDLGRQSKAYYQALLRSLAQHYAFSTGEPVGDLAPEHMGIVLYGSNGEVVPMRYRGSDGEEKEVETTFEGVIPQLRRRYRETSSARVRSRIERYMAPRICPRCRGARLRRESLAVKVAGRSIDRIVAMSVGEVYAWVHELTAADSPLGERERQIAAPILRELVARLGFLQDVGLDYLTMDRSTATLAGGEAQRIRLATQLGATLMGCIYVLDEPSVGLHARDNDNLIQTLQQLRDQGNTILVVEHDAAMIRSADWVVDMGPGAGEQGGQVVASGPPAEILQHKHSLTGQYLSGRRKIALPARRRPGNGKRLLLSGAREHNLKQLELSFPLGCLICVTGVSGSGKSSLVIDTLYRRLAQLLHRAKEPAGAHDSLQGFEHLDKVIAIDQSAIGRTPRSNAATYTGLFGPIRRLFSRVPESRVRGYGPARFSFNVKGGRCEACEGAGILQIEMQFLPDVYVPCEECQGLRYNRETLEIRYKGLNIAEVLDLTVKEAIRFFSRVPSVRNRLQALYDVGLGYLKLGQPAPSLSGGEAQRVKLAAELGRRDTGRTLYVLDEPTTGLHFADIDRLLEVLNRLVDAGNTVVIIEHNLDVIKSADWVIDLGPEGGEGGGRVVAQGAPEEIVRVTQSHTGRFLQPYLG
ncbi:MAG: excinuclease ABC subunit UvrA [Chloroflexia bacterium]|nr:excinuclease ABC subunit UvrA [Chloroflexia bacterium]